MLKINLGSGNRPLKDYENLDIQERVNPDIVCDIATGLPYNDNSVDEVRAFDFLEHIKPENVIGVITEIWRVLKPGGKFESFTPDAEFGQAAYQDPTHVSFWTENSWLYYSSEAYRNLYGTKANFNIEKIERVASEGRVYHLYVVATKREVVL